MISYYFQFPAYANCFHWDLKTPPSAAAPALLPAHSATH